MSTVSEERYVNLRDLCDEVDSDLFEPLSWILILNLDLIPKRDIRANRNLSFSYNLMDEKYKEAESIAQEIISSKNPISKHYVRLLELDPNLKKTIEIARKFFALAHRRIEISKQLGIKKF